jgi:hypothetical protein
MVWYVLTFMLGMMFGALFLFLWLAGGLPR